MSLSNRRTRPRSVRLFAFGPALDAGARRRMVLLLALLLLLTQALGQVHRVVHGLALDAPVAMQAPVGSAPAASPARFVSDGASAFGHAADRIGCGLFDAAALAATMSAAPPAPDIRPAPLLLRLASAIAVPDVQRIAAFLSRAPPRAVRSA